MYQHILLAADGSEYSIRAAEEVVKIASLIPEAMVEILYVADMSKVKGEVLHSLSSEDIQRKRAQKLIPHIEILSKQKIDFKTTFLVGDPGPKIVEYANDQQVDLLVIGSRGLNVFQEFVLGSVSHKVVKRAHCPVMVVKLS